MGWQPANETTWYRISLLIAGILLLTGGTLAVFAGSSNAETSVQMSDFTVQGENVTTTDNVTDVTLSATVNYSHDIPDAEDRIVKLRVGPADGDTELVDYKMDRDVAGTGSGSVTLSGSVLDHAQLSAGDFQPGIAETTTQELVVEALVEVNRENGETETAMVSDSVTVSVEDGSSLTVRVGGSGSVSVVTG